VGTTVTIELSGKGLGLDDTRSDECSERQCYQEVNNWMLHVLSPLVAQSVDDGSATDRNGFPVSIIDVPSFLETRTDWRIFHALNGVSGGSRAGDVVDEASLGSVGQQARLQHLTRRRT
jgi:hypothetical protein